MSKEAATLQKLIHALDDTSALYRGMAPKTTSPHLKFLMQRAVTSHQWIADDLADRMTTTGGDPQRKGSLLGPLRALQANWLARISPDIELAYANRAARCEDGILQCFDEAIAAVTDAELGSRLQMQRSKIECTCTRIECHVSPMLVRVPTAPARQPIRATAHPSEPRTIAHARGRVQA